MHQSSWDEWVDGERSPRGKRRIWIKLAWTVAILAAGAVAIATYITLAG